MAELIDKKAVIKDIASWAIGGNPEEPQMVRIDEIVMLIGTSIEELPTTTEAELRANVIDEFAEKVKEILKSSKEAYENMAFTYAMGGSNNKHMKYIYEGKIDEIRSIEQCVEKIASQMKGEKE